VLRLVVALLLLANAVWFGWSQGWLPAGLLPWPSDEAQREPQRLAAQLHPERIRILPTAGTPGPAEGGNRPTACLQAGPFSAEALDAVEAALVDAGLPRRAWGRVAVTGGTLVRVAQADAAQQDSLRAWSALSPPELVATGGFRPCD